MYLQSMGFCSCGQYLKPCLARSLKGLSLVNPRLVAGTEADRRRGVGAKRGDMYIEKLGGSNIDSGG